MRADLRLGRWQDVLEDVEWIDCLVTDPPFGLRTHDAYASRTHDVRRRREIPYHHLSEGEVQEICDRLLTRVLGWAVIFTSHGLVGAWDRGIESIGRYGFAPIPSILRGRSVRLSGDGPANWTDWLMVSRPRSREFQGGWANLPPYYLGTIDQTTGRRQDRRIGGKPLWLMRRLISDYARPDDVICDPFAGHGTTLLAARVEGHRSIGAECDPGSHAIAQDLLSRPYTPVML